MKVIEKDMIMEIDGVAGQRKPTRGVGDCCEE